MNKKIFTILSLWTITICWHLHYYATRVGSPVPATFGVNIDWTRYHIVQTGRLGGIPDPWTPYSGVAGTQNYDFGSMYLAVINIVTDSTGLVEGLEFLNSLQIVTIIILPVIFLNWYGYITRSRANYDFHTIYVILLLSLFPSVRVITNGTSGWSPNLIAISAGLFAFTLLPKVTESKRHLFLLFTFIFIVLNTYHTYVFLFLMIFTISISYYIISQIISQNHDRTTSVLFSAVLYFWAAFYLTGNYINNRFYELFTSSLNLFSLGLFNNRVSGSTDNSNPLFAARDSDLINSSTQDILSQLGLRQISKIIYHSMAFAVVLLFILMILHSYIHKDNKEVFQDKFEKMVFAALFAFPICLIVFYWYGGLPTAVSRTESIAIYFSILISGLLFREKNMIINNITQVIVIIWVITAVIAAISSGLFFPPHTVEQEQSIKFAGDYISEQSYVFSDPKMGMPLLYYEVQGISMVTTKQPNWEESTEKIYFSRSINKSNEIREVIVKSQKSGSPSVNSFYILLSSYPKTEGALLRTLVTKPTGVDPREGIRFDKSVHNIYSNNKTTLFRSS